MDLSHLKNRQGNRGTHKLLLNPIPTLQFCCASAQRSREWMLGKQESSLGWQHLQSADDSFTGISGSRASRPAGQQTASEYEEAALPYPKSVSM